MADPIVVTVFYTDSESLIKSSTIRATTFADAVTYAQQNVVGSGQIRNCQILTSNLDIKSPTATNSYQLSFYDTNGGITESINIFSDNFNDVSGLINQKGNDGWRLNSCLFRESEFISII